MVETAESGVDLPMMDNRPSEVVTRILEPGRKAAQGASLTDSEGHGQKSCDGSGRRAGGGVGGVVGVDTADPTDSAVNTHND